MASQYGFYGYGGLEYAGPPVANSPYVSTNGGLFPTRFLEIAPGYGPNDTNPVWVNIAADVMQISTRRGRQRVLGRFEPGTMTVIIDNKSGRYSPFNAASPYYNQIRPGMPIRFRALWGSMTYSEFTGFVESWPLTWPAANDAAVSVTAVDAMKFLNMKKATSINWYSTVITADAPIVWHRFNEAVGAMTIADATGNGHTLVAEDANNTAGVAVKGTLYNAFQQPGVLVADTDASVYTGNKDIGWKRANLNEFSFAAPSNFSVECWVKLLNTDVQQIWYLYQITAGLDHISLETAAQSSTVAAGTAKLVVTTTATGTLNTTVNIRDGQWHHIVATATGAGVYTLYIDGYQQGQMTDTTTNANPYVEHWVGLSKSLGADAQTMDGFIDEFAIYNYTLTATQAMNHYLAGVKPRQLETTGARISYLASYTGIPAANQKIDTGNTTVQGATATWLTGTLLQNMQDQADTEAGDLFIDAAGNLTFFDRYHTSRSPYGSVALILGDSGAAPEEPYRLDGLTVPYDDQDVENEIVATAASLAPQTVSDATSQTQYGKRTQSINLLSSTVADAGGRANYELSLYKTPVPRVDSVTVNPADDPTMLFGPVLGFDVLSRVELRRRPMDGSGSTFDQTLLIEGIEHRVTKATWETTWRLSSTDAFRFFILDDPVAGVLDDPLNILGY
jgi:hypothetical protein